MNFPHFLRSYFRPVLAPVSSNNDEFTIQIRKSAGNSKYHHFIDFLCFRLHASQRPQVQDFDFVVIVSKGMFMVCNTIGQRDRIGVTSVIETLMMAQYYIVACLTKRPNIPSIQGFKFMQNISNFTRTFKAKS